jgi:hypothetical protein
MMGPLASRRDEVRLADGSRVTIRPVDPGDKPLIAAAFEEFSEQSAVSPLLYGHSVRWTSGSWPT